MRVPALVWAGQQKTVIRNRSQCVALVRLVRNWFIPREFHELRGWLAKNKTRTKSALGDIRTRLLRSRFGNRVCLEALQNKSIRSIGCAHVNHTCRFPCRSRGAIKIMSSWTGADARGSILCALARCIERSCCGCCCYCCRNKVWTIRLCSNGRVGELGLANPLPLLAVIAVAFPGS